MSIITLADAKAYLKIPLGDNSHDSLLNRFVNGITGAIEDYKHEVVAKQSITERLSLTGRQRFRLWRVPVLDLVSLTTVDGSITWDVSTSVLDVDPDTGLVEVISGQNPCGRFKAVYNAGYDPVPEKYVQGAFVVLEHVWETQRGAGQASWVPGAVGAEESRDLRYMYTFPRKAREWLGPPRPVIG